MSDETTIQILAQGLNDALRSLAGLASKATGGGLLYDDPEMHAEIIGAAIAERDRLAKQVEAMSSSDKLSIMFGWLVYEVGEHTCCGYGPESGYLHEPGCGYEPVLKLSELHGWPEQEATA